MKPTLSLVLVNTGTKIGLLKMQTEQEREIRETPEIKEQREQKKGAAVLTPDETPSYPIGLILGGTFLLGNLLVAAIYFHVINP
jgi:hypothetical protein